MKQFTYLLAFILGTLFTSAQEMRQDAPITTVAFETTTIDYKTISKGADGSKVFTFKNTGAETLYIYDVFSTSHCKVLSKPTKGIAPGESGEIKIVYDTNHIGKIVKTITVKANVKNTIIALRLIGTVI